MVKLDLGCGRTKRRGHIGIDIFDYSRIYPPGEFIQQNLSEGIPFKDNEVERLHSSHLIEHLPDHFNKEKQIIENGVDWFMEEIHRVCKPGAIVELEVPIMNFWEYHKTVFRKSAFKCHVAQGMFDELSRKKVWNRSFHWYSLFNVKVILRVKK